MKLLIATTAIALISTTASAGNSDRYNDLRLDTSETSDRVYSKENRPTDLERAQRGQDQKQSSTDGSMTPDVTFSSRNAAKSNGEGYLYGGFGDGNDSR